MGQRQRLDDAGRAALREVAPRIVAEFRGEHNRKRSSRREMRWGRKGSFSLVIAGPKAGCWFDHELGRGGDIIEFIKAERGCSFAEARDFAAQFVPVQFVSAPRPMPRTVPDDDDEERRIARALSIWSEVRPLRGTLAEKYLRSRCIEVPDTALAVLAFHPACPWEGSRLPALVALVRDIVTDEPLGIHRTALSADGRKIDHPKALGAKSGGAIKLSSESGITTELTIGEGLETTLSAMMLGFAPAWSAIDAGELSMFPVLPGIARLTIAVDNDVSGAGQGAAAKTRARWEAAGLRVRTVMSPTPGHDLNDVLRARAGRQ